MTSRLSFIASALLLAHSAFGASPEAVAEKETAIADAIWNGKTAELEELLKGETPSTPQHMAALGLDRELGAALDANPQLLKGMGKDDVRPPILHAAALHGRKSTVDLLLNRGISVDLPDQDTLTPLHVVAMHGRLEMVKHLLEQKADINARTGLRFVAGLQAGAYTPMQLAVGRNHPEVVDFLCENGAKLDDPGFPFDRMLKHVLYANQGRLVDVLLARRGKEHWPALLKSAIDPIGAHNPNLILESLVRLGVDVPKALPEPPIHWAMASGYPDLALLFIEHGADVRKVHDGGSPLSRAAERGYDRIVARLLELKVDVDSGTTTGTTPLQFAAFYGRPECVKLLLKHGADIKRIPAVNRAELEGSTNPDHKAIAELLREHAKD